jgi:hypothetical protein
MTGIQNLLGLATSSRHNQSLTDRKPTCRDESKRAR